MWGLELIGGVMGPWRAGEAALCVVQRVSSRGMGVGGFSSSDWDRRMLMADSSTYLLRNACLGEGEGKCSELLCSAEMCPLMLV